MPTTTTTTTNVEETSSSVRSDDDASTTTPSASLSSNNHSVPVAATAELVQEVIREVVHEVVVHKDESSSKSSVNEGCFPPPEKKERSDKSESSVKIDDNQQSKEAESDSKEWSPEEEEKNLDKKESSDKKKSLVDKEKTPDKRDEEDSIESGKEESHDVPDKVESLGKNLEDSDKNSSEVHQKLSETTEKRKEKDPKEQLYHVKWILWRERPCPIITQNENGPCPLISIINVLLLRGGSTTTTKISLVEGSEIVTAEQLMEFLANTILQSVPNEMSLDYEANMNEAIAILPKMQTGLDVNVRFTGVRDFEYTPECIIFDLLNVSLYHGWLVDPNNEMELCSVVQQLSYNQLVEKIISDKTSQDSDLVGQSLLAQQFLETSASQLTYHGLVELNSTMKDGEIAVFFRNNHFSTILKHKDELFLLVTDQGFLKEPKVVWETLDSVDGDVLFVDDNFKVVPPKQEVPNANSQAVPLTQEQQIDQDLLLAMTLQEEDKRCRERDQEWENKVGDTSGLTDEELAKRLQEEGNEAAAAAVAQQQQQQQQQLHQQQQHQQQQQQRQQPPSVPSSSSPSSPGRRRRTASSSGGGGAASNSRTTSPNHGQRKNCTIL